MLSSAKWNVFTVSTFKIRNQEANLSEVFQRNFILPLSFAHRCLTYTNLTDQEERLTLFWDFASCPLLTFDILKLYNFYFRISSFTPHIKRHMGVLKHLTVIFIVFFTGWKAPSARVVAVHSRVDSNSHWSRSSHSSDRLAVGRSWNTHGTKCWASHVMRMSLVVQAILIARSWMPFSRNFKSVPARAVRRWSQSFPHFLLGLSALMPHLLCASLWIWLQSGTWLMPWLWLYHLKDRCSYASVIES